MPDSFHARIAVHSVLSKLNYLFQPFQEIAMRTLTILAASLAIPAVIASAQTPAPATTSSQSPYIPLFGTNGGGGGTSGGGGGTGSNTSSTWYIDTARNLIVLCTQTPGGTGAQSFSCFAQTVQTLPAGTAPSPAPQGGAPSGGAGGTTGAGPAPGTPAAGTGVGTGTPGTTGVGTGAPGTTGAGTSGGAGSNPMGG